MRIGYGIVFFLTISFIPLKSLAIINVECSTNFPCPEDLKPKIEFWIKIFGEYTKSTAVFHDSEAPEVVYSVLSGDLVCTQKNSGPAEQEKNRIKSLLKSIQDKSIEANPIYTAEEQIIVSQFKKSKFFELDKATERVRCQNGVRDQFEKALSRYQYFKSEVAQILKDANLPEEIQFLPFVESSYNHLAYSKVGAAGLWQIMPSTARVLGLKINAATDERMDPILATKAATRYFENAYQAMSQSAASGTQDLRSKNLGPFVITSYNYGIGGMKKALELHGTDFMDVLNNYKGKSFRVAVKNFYASFLAARHLVTNQQKYFQKTEPYTFPQYKILNTPKSISAVKFAQNFKIPIETLRELNPVLTSRVWSGSNPIPQYFPLKIPFGSSPETLSKNISALPASNIEVKIQTYKVRKGDSICNIAKKLDISCTEFKSANGLKGKGIIRVGQLLNIPNKTVAMVPPPEVKETTPPKTTTSKSQESILVIDEKTESVPPPVPVSEGISKTATSKTKAPSDTQVIAELPAIESTTNEVQTTAPSDDWLLVLKNNEKYYIYVEAEETLGHFSDWIEGVTTQDIRNLNNIPFEKPLTIGQMIFLPITNEGQKSLFEQKRIEYHQTLEEEFDDRYTIIAYTTHLVKKGDTEWILSSDLQLPMWLIKKTNPQIVQKSFKPGDTLKIPILKAKTSTN